MCDKMGHVKYNVWQNGIFKLQCVTQWNILNYNVWQNRTCQIQCVTKWDMSNTMCDKMGHLNYNVWHNETF